MKTKLFFLITICTCFASCGQTPEDFSNRKDVLNFGRAEYYRGWGLFNITPQNPIITKTIHFDYENMDEGKPVVFELGKDGKPLTEAELCIINDSGDTIWCDNGRFTVIPPQSSITIGLRFKDAEKREADWHDWELRVVESGDVERLEFPTGNVSLKEKAKPAILRFRARLEKNMNRPRVAVDTTLIAIVVCLLLWICFLKFIIFERIKVRKITIEDNDSERKIAIRGALSLTLSNKNQKQNIFERIFVGKRLYYRHDFFTDGEIIVMPRNRKTVRLKVSEGYNLSQFTISKDDDTPLKIENSKHQKVDVSVV